MKRRVIVVKKNGEFIATCLELSIQMKGKNSENIHQHMSSAIEDYNKSEKEILKNNEGKVIKRKVRFYFIKKNIFDLCNFLLNRVVE